ncbi:MAG: HAMP domain-containing histidine kinase [Candidatus Gastranaerophilales bacterium]|nr:HAMP domain-containing histidine kinase [Candidatus Gastranaerophilales bacterium]
MRFADKLFFLMTVLLTIIFSVFGVWLLASYFQRSVDRELEQGNVESQTFQYLFEVAYHSLEEYGDGYAIPKAIESVVKNLEKDGTQLFVIGADQEFYYGEETLLSEGYLEPVTEMLDSLGNTEVHSSSGYETANSYVSGIREREERYILFSISVTTVAGQDLYLGLSRDVSEVYEERHALLNQYRFTLFVLLLIGGISIYIMSRYITRPIRALSRVAGRIASGAFEMRSHNNSQDEIGMLADSFNRMADRLVEQMKEMEAEAKRKELEAKQKEDFTAAFAHELKTPLTSIIGYADMLNTIELGEEERREAYFYIFSQGKRLESLSHKLLDLVSMEKHPLVSKPISARQLEENLRATMRPIFRKRGIKGKISMEKGVIYGDYELLLSLFYNLLDNAVKAVEADGFILMKGKMLEEGYEVKVVDNGRGIPQEEIGRITEAFYMVDKSRSRKEGGAGIGMALCQKIITLHNGNLQISSKVGEGTVMRLLFPVFNEEKVSILPLIGEQEEQREEYAGRRLS